MKKSALYCASAIAAIVASPAYAQSAQGDGSNADNNPAQLQDIIVTAQKRSENLQTVPVAVSNVQAETLEAAGATSVLDVKVTVPSLNSFNTNGYATSSIRGVGSIGNGPGVEYPVAIYVDGVYLATPLASTLQLNNIAAVDVLKGPQGTLFGRNSTGGLIQVTTRNPGATTEGKLEVGYGNYGTLFGTAYVSGAATSNLFADFAFSGKGQSKGWGKNLATGKDAYRVYEDLSVRSKIVYEPGPDTTLTLIGDYSHSVDSLGSFTVLPGSRDPNLGNAANPPSPTLPGTTIAPDRGYNVNNAKDARGHVDAGGASLRIEQDIGSVKLTSISAYRQVRFNESNTIDFSPLNPPAIDYHFLQPDDTFTQELQLGSNSNSARFKWTVGAYYFNSKSAYKPEFLTLRFPAYFNLGFTRLDQVTSATLKADSLAGYAQGSYELFTDTNVTVGARYTYERRRLLDNANVLIFDGFPTPAVPLPDLTKKFRKLTYRLGVDHRFSDQVFGYVSYNRGFKSGGFNPLENTFRSYDPEQLDAYEAGLKTDLLDRRLRINVAGFYYDYSNIQLQRLAANGGFYVLNAAAARTYGAEADVTAVLSSSLTINLGGTWLHPFFRKSNCSTGVPGGGVPLVQNGSCDGNQLPVAAKLVATMGIHYETDLGGGKLNADANAYYNSGFYFEPDNIVRQKRYALVGASLKWTSESGVTLRAFGKNLTNKRILNYGATIGSGEQVAQWAEPRTYGIAVGYEF